MDFQIQTTTISPPVEANYTLEDVKTWWKEILENWPIQYSIFPDGDHDLFASSVAKEFGANVENLTLTGSSAINGTGNTLDNVLTGNGGNNTLNGGAGNDTYIFSLGGGSDTVTDAGSDASTQDLILFNNDVLEETVAFFQSGQNLMIGYGSTETINVTSQFQSTSGVERIQLSDGLFLTETDISQVIQNINAFATSHGITLTSVNDVRNNTDLMNIIASSWHA